MVKRTTRERENRQLLHFFLLVSTYSNGPETWSLPPVPQRAVGPELTILDCGMHWHSRFYLMIGDPQSAGHYINVLL